MQIFHQGIVTFSVIWKILAPGLENKPCNVIYFPTSRATTFINQEHALKLFQKLPNFL